MKYYFCETESFQRGIPTFNITSKEYFDTRGFLADTASDVKRQDLPVKFERISDATYEYLGEGDPIQELLKTGNFLWRDMVKEIHYTYVRRRLLGIDDQLL